MSDNLDKIRKLWAKAEGTTNPHEAAIFMAKAQELMDRDGVSMEQVDLSAIKRSEVKSRFSAKHIKMHEGSLMQLIAQAFGCKLLWLPMVTSETLEDGTTVRYNDSYGRFIFVGPQDRLELAVYSAEVLLRQMVKARQEFATKQSKYYWDIAYGETTNFWDKQEIKKTVGSTIRKHVTQDADSFAVGWVFEISKKVTKFALNGKEQALLDASTASVPEGDGPKKKELNANFHKGVEAAKDASLYRPMESGGTPTVGLLGQTLKLGHG